MPSLVGVGKDVSLTVRAYGNFSERVAKTLDSVNRILALQHQKTGGTFVYCTWKQIGKHSETKCTYKARIVRGGAKKMRHHFAKENFRELQH